MGRTGKSRLLVVGWHNVEGTWRYPAAAGTGAAAFAKQLRALRRVCTVVPLEKALTAMHAGRPLPPRSVALTFDDGYRDNLENAVPILRELEMPATIFLVPGFLSGKVHAWWERLGWAFEKTDAKSVEFGGQRLPLGPLVRRRAVMELVEAKLKYLDEERRHQQVEQLVDQLAPRGPYDADRIFLDWDGARELAHAGITIGSHTMSHAILANESPESVAADLAQSRSLLQEELDVDIHTLAYPNGQASDYDAATIAAARDAGYRSAITAHQLVNGPDTPSYEIRRTLISPDVPPAKLIARMAKGVARDF